jgi:hypothetical protein
MRIFSHLREDCFSWETLLAAFVAVDQERLTSFTLRDSSDCGSSHRVVLGWKKNCRPLILVWLVLTLPLGALSQWIDEGEFSQAMLAHKLRLLKDQFEQAETQLPMRSGAAAKVKELQRVYAEIKCLEAEFRRGRYYPDLLDEQIVTI